ncbi:hypothetical protein N665_0368s0042 [Sinapis alba]|nr:hypothetical protein N665_0368s0042 [Sinapis alba]
MESPLLHASSSLLSLRPPSIYGRDSFTNPPRDDNHSVSTRPDEATGPFPESILLKEKKTDEEGDLLPEFVDAEEKELYEFLDLQLQSDLNEERMRHYEVVYLIHEKHAEEVESVNEKEKKGKFWRFSDWGMRRLAYKIQKAEDAHYILMNFEIEAKHLNEFKGMLDGDERVIKHLVMKRDEAITEDCTPPPEFHSVRASMNDVDDFYDDDKEEDDDVEYEVDEDGNVVMVVYEDEGEEDGDDELEQGQDQSNNAIRENQTTSNVGGG